MDYIDDFVSFSTFLLGSMCATYYAPVTKKTFIANQIMAINSKTMAYGLVKDILFMVGIWRQSLADMVVEIKVASGQSWLFRAVVYRDFYNRQ